MKNNSLDDIVKCNVEVSNPASNDESFDSILLVVPKPKGVGEKEMTKTTSISTADELLDYGFTTEDAAYIAAEVAFSQNPAPGSLYVCIRKEAEGVMEDVKETLNRAASEVAFYGYHLTDFKDEADVKAAVEWAEAHEKIFAFEYTDYSNFPVKNTNYFRSFGIFSGNADGFGADDQPKVNEYAALAEMAKCFGYQPGTETWAMKELSVIVPSVLGSTEKKELEDKNISMFLRYAGSNITIGGKMLSGEWIDVIRFRDWLKAEMQTNVFNAIKVNRKVPFTDAGIGLIEGAMNATLLKGQTVGGIAPTEYDRDDNAIPGFTVVVPKASDLTEAERKSRKLTGCRWSARLAGAIHAVEIEGYLTF